MNKKRKHDELQPETLITYNPATGEFVPTEIHYDPKKVSQE